ncbi:MAG TPA: ABC transporter permease subunit [Thermoanaerobaculia bacterium]|nr:ABC transporter permease subunit [Thermoanaerobaculia bacterium]
MAVHRHGFRAYRGRWTPAWSRFLVLTRYGLRDALGSRKTLFFLIAACFYPLAAAVIIYLHHNAEALKMLQIPVDQIFPIDAGFFLRLVRVQSIFAFFVVLTSGATLISTDMRDNALPLYLGRPLSRLEYVAGKLLVIALLASAVTWVPGLLLYGLQVSLEGGRWMVGNPLLATGTFLGSWLTIAVFAFVCLAISAVMRAKAAAEGAFASFFLLLPLLGGIIGATLRTDLGALLHIPLVLDTLWRTLFGMPPVQDALSPLAAAAVVTVLLAACCILLARRVRAYEVVR